jgi:type I restriction enzyme S subunit
MEMTATKSTFQKYPAYKNSGVEWLGEIPEHWEIGKLGTLLKPVSIKNQPNLPLLSITREAGVIERNIEDDSENHNFIPDDLSGYKLLNEGQFGMNKMKAWQGSYGIAPMTGIVSPAYYVFDFNNSINSRFFHLAIRSKNYVAFFGQASDGVRVGQWDLNKSRMKEIPFFIPPIEEQTAIANFLDDKTTKIDRAIAQKEKMIALLKERKQIIIQNAVTKGLNPNAKMKDSGVEWIGEIPEHYTITKLGLCLKPVSEKNRHDLPLLSITRELGVIIRDTDDQDSNHNFIPDDLSGYKVIRAGQFGMNKMKAWQGSYGVSSYDGIVSPAYYVFDLISDINPDFFHLAIRSKIYVPFFAAASDGVRIGQWDLNKSRMKEIPLVIPPLNEQLKAIEFIQLQTEKIEKAVSIQEQQIEKLKELKSTLIASAVTGKIKVS